MVKKFYQLMVASAFAAGMAYAAPADLPETGQTTCYDASGNLISCTDTGQDGDIRAGVAWPGQRFTDNGNGTVADNLTGLIWLKNADCFSTRTWTQALTDANTLASGTCGLTDGSQAGDWRLPNVNELESLINAEEANTATWLGGQGFSNVQGIGHWSSTTKADDTLAAWIVRMDSGSVGNGLKQGSFYVWPVHAGQ